MSEPVRYWDNGNVKMPATYPSLLKECDRLRAENQRLREENDNLRDTEKRLMGHIDAKTGDCVQDEMWDDMWHLAHPNDSSWEYPGQVIREVSHAFSELRAENQRLREACDKIQMEWKKGVEAHPSGPYLIGMQDGISFCNTVLHMALEVRNE